jgi:hypothetical protein
MKQAKYLAGITIMSMYLMTTLLSPLRKYSILFTSSISKLGFYMSWAGA